MLTKQQEKFLTKEIGETRINGTNGNTEYWSGDNYGWQSENGHNEALLKEKERADSAIDKPLWDAVDNGKEAVGQAVGSFLSAIPGVKEIGGAVHFATTTVEETAQNDRDFGTNGGDYSPANIAVGLNGAWQQGVNQFANGARSNYRAVESLIENGTGVELDDRGRDAYAGAVTFAAEEIATLGAGKLLKGVKNLPTKPPSLKPATIVADRGQVHFTTPDLAQQLNQPLQIASNMEVSGWEKSVKTLVQEQADPEQIKRVLSRSYHKDLKKAGYEYVSLDDIAKDKDGWLSALINRAEDLGVDMKEYRKLTRQGASSSTKGNQQRIMYDNFTDNPRDAYKQMYDPNNPIRKAVAQTFNTVLGKEWHHIFGNKEAAEFMLSQVAQDPYIAANLFEHMKKIGLATSGKADNISLIGIAGHRKRGGYHSWSKKLGLENKGRKRGDLEISEYGQAISESILSGETGVEELFSILEVYARVNNQVIKPKLAELGGQTISEMGQVNQFVQGVAKRNPKVGSRMNGKKRT